MSMVISFILIWVVVLQVDLTEGIQLSSVHGQNYFCQLPSKALEMEQKNSNEVSFLD